MPILPIPLLLSLLVGLFSLAILAASLGLLYRALRRYRSMRTEVAHFVQPPLHPKQPILQVDQRRVQNPLTSAEALRNPSVAAPLAIGLALFLLTLFGRRLVALAFPSGNDEPKELHSGTVQDLTRPDGTNIHIETFGRPDAPTLVFTHGWGTSSTEWYYAKRDLAERFRLVFWDLPGLGQSTQPNDRNYALEKMASDLEAVVSAVHGERVVLTGHSIGGMINLTFCRLFPDQLGSQVAGLAEIDTSYTNPATTTKDAELSTTLQKPVAEPLLHVMIWLSPLFRAMNWLSYQNGAAQIMNANSSFAGSETWGEVDLVSSYQYKSSPAVVARGTLAMFHWDAKPVLPRINVPVLIIVGQQDTTTLPSASEYMRGAIPKADLRIVSPSAHYGLLEQNRRYNDELARFASALQR